jgi:hypothetical protein
MSTSTSGRSCAIRRIPYDTHAFAGQGDYSELTSPLMDEYKVPLNLLQSVYRDMSIEQQSVPSTSAAAAGDDSYFNPINRASRTTSGLLSHHQEEEEDGKLTPMALEKLHERRTTCKLIGTSGFSYFKPLLSSICTCIQYDLPTSLKGSVT